MAGTAGKEGGDWLLTTGILIFVLTAGLPGLFVAGFHDGPNWSLLTYAGIATLGGAAGGALMGRGHWLAGLFGGAVAGPCGLFAVAGYVEGRESVHNLELVIAQAVGSLPGLGLYYLLKVAGQAAFQGGPTEVDLPERDYADRFGDRRLDRDDRDRDRRTDIER